ncbi:MAG: hypothetical protein KJ955_08600 [Nanoarchaeota archaeon]|nr:hypothetical protein [Nanoarchaeota archaeon]
MPKQKVSTEEFDTGAGLPLPKFLCDGKEYFTYEERQRAWKRGIAYERRMKLLNKKKS